MAQDPPEKAYPNRKKEMAALIANDQKGMKSNDGSIAAKAYGDYAVHKSWEEADRKADNKPAQRKKVARKRS